MSTHAHTTLLRSEDASSSALTSKQSLVSEFTRIVLSFGIDTSGGIDNITWPSGISLISAAIIGTLVFIYLQRSWSPSISTSSLKKKKIKMMASKPEDGSIRIAGIFVHPIKSCRGTPLQTAKYTPEGLEHDRRWCILDASINRIITARDFPRMVLIHPRIELNASLPYMGLLHVTFPDDSGCPGFIVPLQPTEDVLSTWEILDQVTLFPGVKPLDGYISQFPSGSSFGPEGTTPSSILSNYFGKPVHLIYKGPRIRPIEPTVEFPELKATAVYQDGYPLLVLSEESMEDVNREVKDRVGTQGISEAWKEDTIVIRRFRPNIIVSGGGPFAEDNWKEVTIGSQDAPPISLVSKCARCLLPNVSPDTGEADKAVPYKVLMKFRTGLDPIKKMKPCVGCNGVPDGQGIVNVGDVVYVKKVWGE